MVGVGLGLLHDPVVGKGDWEIVFKTNVTGPEFENKTAELRLNPGTLKSEENVLEHGSGGKT